MAIGCVIFLGVTAQTRNVEVPFLPLSVSECDCIVNATIADNSAAASDSIANDWFEMIFQVSYMYYSMIGTLLTIFFGLVVSMLSNMYTKNQILKIKSSHDIPRGFRTPGHFSVASFTLATGRKLSSFIHHVAHDVSQSTLRVENKLKEVISHTNLHLHHGLHGDAEDRISILNDVDGDCEVPMRKETGARKMFFIGYYEDEEHEDRSRRESDFECDAHSKLHFK
jgi:hypothetical protein